MRLHSLVGSADRPVHAHSENSVQNIECGRAKCFGPFPTLGKKGLTDWEIGKKTGMKKLGVLSYYLQTEMSSIDAFV